MLNREYAQNHREAVVVKLLQVVLVSALLLIFQILVALAQVHHSLDLVVTITQEQVLR
jgi:hypothetical protein